MLSLKRVSVEWIPIMKMSAPASKREPNSLGSDQSPVTRTPAKKTLTWLPVPLKSREK